MKNCFDLGIPKHLHKNERGQDSEFQDDELLFRRYKEENQIFSTQRMSVNRSKYGQSEDVLYNVNSSNHFNHWGIVSIKVGQLRKFQFAHPEKQGIKYSLTVVHSPSDCMYPHSEIIILQNDIQLDSLDKPKSARTEFMMFCEQNFIKVKSPESQ